jgi:hypothetical protein
MFVLKLVFTIWLQTKFVYLKASWPEPYIWLAVCEVQTRLLRER